VTAFENTALDNSALDNSALDAPALEKPTLETATLETSVLRLHAASASASLAGHRRRELAEFLRTRRARLRPEHIGLPPGARRRTPGLRREEVAQEAGVGVTWYTWLEQGRDIKASGQVLDAVARALRLDEAEREHLYQLADLPLRVTASPEPIVSDALIEVLRTLDPLPAILMNSRWDLLATNEAYRQIFRAWHARPCEMRNMIWCTFMEPEVRACYLNFEAEAPRSVAQLRAASVHHLGEPGWTDFISALIEGSPDFARMWARHDVARPGVRVKQFLDPRAGLLRMVTTSLAVTEMPECRVIIYTPADDETRARLPLTRTAPARNSCPEGSDGARAEA
jgi:transcriptional regulator with XRE-family HTH domain